MNWRCVQWEKKERCNHTISWPPNLQHNWRHSPCTVRLASDTSDPIEFIAVQVYLPLSPYWTSSTVSSPNPAPTPFTRLIWYLSVSFSVVLMMDSVLPSELVKVQNTSCSGTAEASHWNTALLPLLISNWSTGGTKINGRPEKNHCIILSIFCFVDNRWAKVPDFTRTISVIVTVLREQGTHADSGSDTALVMS